MDLLLLLLLLYQKSAITDRSAQPLIDEKDTLTDVANVKKLIPKMYIRKYIQPKRASIG